MSDKLTAFLGDSLSRTIIKLVVISFVVGIVMSALNFTPYDVWQAFRDFFIGLYNLGFEALGSIAKYFLWGAAVVVPIFLFLCFIKFGK